MRRDGTGAIAPRSSWSGRLQAACDATEQLGFGTSGGERDANLCCGLGDASGNFDQPHAQGSELGCGERLWFGDGVAHRQH